jgi:predicted dehydrogenase
MKKIKVALVGTGNWCLQHCRVLTHHPQVFFCGILGRNKERTKKRAKLFNVPYYLDLQELIRNQKPDLINISLPNEHHYDMTMKVIKSSCHLFVEKPLVFKMQEAKKLLAEAKKRKLFFGINFNWRYSTPVSKAIKTIKENKLGDINFITWRFGGTGGGGDPFGNIIETQCHGFDMLEYLNGPIKSVHSFMTNKTNNGFSTFVVSMKFKNKSVGSLVGSYDTSYAYPNTHYLEINGSKGRILIEDQVRKYSFNKKDDETAEVWQSGFFNDYERDFHRTFDVHFNEVIKNFINNKEPPVHAKVGKRALELALSSIDSYKKRKRVDIK